MRQKTREQLKREVYDLVGEEYTVLGEYKDNRTKILMRHNVCGSDYEVRPYNFLRGDRCPGCYGNTRKTPEQFRQEVYNLVSDEYTVLGEYKNNRTKILMRHNRCGHEYTVAPKSFLYGYRCPECYGSKRKTTEQFVQEVYDLTGKEYTVLGEYKDNRTKILMRHNTCGSDYEVQPSCFLRGNRCPECYGNRRKTTEQFVDEVHDLVGEEYTVLGEYKNSRAKIPMRHNACGTQYTIKPENFLSGCRCPECYGNKRKTSEQFKQEVHDLVGEEYMVLGEYKNNRTKVLILHNTCEGEYEVTPIDFLGGRRCPRCSRSHGELAIEKILKENHVSYVSEYSFPGSRYRYDFAVFGSSDSHPDSHDNSRHNNSINTSQSAHKARRGDKPVLLIEFDGQQHFEPVEAWGGEETLKEIQRRDRAKNRLAEKHNVPLLRIRYDQFDTKLKEGVESLKELLFREINITLDKINSDN